MSERIPFATLSWGALLAGWRRDAVPLDQLVNKALQLIDHASPAELVPVSDLLTLSPQASTGDVDDILAQLTRLENLPPVLSQREWRVAELAALLTTIVPERDDPDGSQVTRELTDFWDAHDHPADVPLAEYLFLVEQSYGAEQREYVIEEHARWVEREQRVVTTLIQLWREGHRAAVQTLLEGEVWAQTYAKQRFERADMERRALERALGDNAFSLVLRDIERINSSLMSGVELERERKAQAAHIRGSWLGIVED
ncbi:hypothetical protein [Deinococcus sonorensis]|uniref:Uncharacterized protein n=1 Tax=Deinococcus sonorensis TaxID=309891 RepID=A0ABV8YBH2_9DEIO